MNRDFHNESLLNFFLRFSRALRRRLNGYFLLRIQVFNVNSRGPLSFDPGFRFINSKAIQLQGHNAFGLNARIECYDSPPAFPANNTHSVKVVIGRNSTFGDNCHIGASQHVEIGDNVLIGSNVLIIDHSHGSPRADLSSKNIVPFRDRSLYSSNVVIGDCVWVCDNAKILPGSRIGKGSIVASNAVVKGIHPEFSLIR